MRIIAGEHKGRRLSTPTWDGVRPTSDRLRETLFNILATRIPGARVLDVFAGTGAVALEAISRGAASAVCIEQDRRAQALIAENRARLGADERCMIVRADARRALHAPIAGGPFEIVFLDPPYDVEDLDDLVTAAAACRAAAGVLVVEHASRRSPPALAGRPPQRSVKAGDSTLSFYL
jgi:16S rRNA (guanine966-N2)-methyltransferase